MKAQDKPLLLEILKLEKMLKMGIFEHDESALTVRHYGQRKVSFPEINKLCQELIFILNKADKHGLIDDTNLKNLKNISRLLWDQLLTKAVKEKLSTSRSRDLVVSVDEELIHIPWELLCDADEFISLKFNMGRVLRSGSQTTHPQYRSASSRVKMLILADPTADLKSAYIEGVAIKNKFDRKRDFLNVDFKSTAIDTLFVKKNLHDYDIVHFAGHCEYDKENKESSGWVLTDGKLTARDILTMGETMPLPSLIFSNACQSAQVEDVFFDKDYQSKSYSLASAFLFSGVRHYIGAIQRVEDAASLAFAKEFYSQLSNGLSVGESVRLSRLSLVKEYGIHSIHWARYLLYGNPSVDLFGKKEKIEIAQRPYLAAFFKKYKKQSLRLSAVLLTAVSLLAVSLLLPTRNPGVFKGFLKAKHFYSKGQNDLAISCAEEALKKDPSFLGLYPLIAQAYERQGLRQQALQYYFDYALASTRRSDTKNLASAYTMIGWLYQAEGKYKKAYEFYSKALEISVKNSDSFNEAVAMRKKAVWHMDKDENDLALELLTKSAEINRERQFYSEYRYNLACDYFDLGLLFFNKNDIPAAKEFYGKSLALFERIRQKDQNSDYFFNLGEIYVLEKEYPKALDYYEKGLLIDQEQNNMPNISIDSAMIGALYLEMDNFVKAESYFKQAYEISDKLNLQPELASACYNMGLLYKKKGYRNKARQYLRQAQEIYVSAEYPEYKSVKEELLALDPS
jgi:CHAT domain-containing protein/Tfp pilus assembly protein PilF